MDGLKGKTLDIKMTVDKQASVLADDMFIV